MAKRTIRFILTLLLLLLRVAVFGEKTNDPQAALATCQEAARTGDDAGAAAAADHADAVLAAAQERGENPKLHLLQARVSVECRIPFAEMMARGELAAEAEDHLQRALELAPKAVPIRAYYGRLLYHLPPFLNRTGDAVQQLEEVLTLSREGDQTPAAEFFRMLGDLYQRQEQSDKANATWKSGLAVHPNDAGLRERLRGAEGEANEGSNPAGEAAPATSGGVAALDAFLAPLVDRPEVVGMTVALGFQSEAADGPILVRAYGSAELEHGVAASEGTLYRIGSVSKQFLAATALRLVAAGKLSLEDPVRRWLPEYPNAAATVHHLLSHTAGLPRDVTAGDGEGDWLANSLQAGLEPPGEAYRYSNLGYALLGLLVERVTGTDYPTLLREETLPVAGLDDDSLRFCDEREILPHRAQGYQWQGNRLLNDVPLRPGPAIRYAGGLCATAPALIRWQRALRSGRVVSPELWQRMRTPASVAAAEGSSYGYGLHIRQQGPLEVIHHGGGVNGFLAELAYYPELGLDVALLTNSEASRPRAWVASVATAVAAQRTDSETVAMVD